MVGIGRKILMTRGDIIRFAAELAKEEDRALDLWTWLPSYKAAVAAHGDYASEYRPPMGDLLCEATLFISHKLNPTPEQMKEAGTFYRCPCGECSHSQESQQQT